MLWPSSPYRSIQIASSYNLPKRKLKLKRFASHRKNYTKPNEWVFLSFSKWLPTEGLANNPLVASRSQMKIGDEQDFYCILHTIFLQNGSFLWNFACLKFVENNEIRKTFSYLLNTCRYKRHTQMCYTSASLYSQDHWIWFDGLAANISGPL